MAAEFNRTKLPGTPHATWRSLDDFMRVVEKRGSAINFAFYVGAASAREMVIGSADRAPTAGFPSTSGTIRRLARSRDFGGAHSPQLRI